MKIRKINISNFRGIQSLEWIVPDTNIICLIGKGDTTKSTVLDAIRYALFPAWNPSFNELDFFQADTDKHIEITLTVTGLLESFKNEFKYGLHLRGWCTKEEKVVDEPGERLEEALTVRLRIDQNLEPSWSVICDRLDDIPFKFTDRIKAHATYIGAYTDNHLAWGKDSALSRITEKDNISELLSGVAKSAKDALDGKREKLANFDEAAKSVQKIAKDFGVPVSDGYKAHLDTGKVNIHAGGLSLHDEQIPLRRLGLGSKRMLILGIQQQGLKEPHITLIDEIEIGLEPHRLARLLKKLSEDQNGQYFLTTHSPVVLRELTTEQLSTVKSKDGKTEITWTAIPAIRDIIQGKIRSGAEAFLAKKIIVCEGPTEVGICKGLNDYWIHLGDDPFSFHGVSTFNAGGGGQIRATGEALLNLGYEVFVVGDSDSDENFSEDDALELRKQGATVIRWPEQASMEEFFFDHLPWSSVLKSIELAMEIHGNDSVIQQVQSRYPKLSVNPPDWTDSSELRTAIGKSATKKGWFKRQDWSRRWAHKADESLNDPVNQIGQYVEMLKTWTYG